MEEGDRSAVSRSLITNAWPPEQSYCYFQGNMHLKQSTDSVGRSWENQ